MANGSNYELNTNNINALFLFDSSIGPQTDVEFLFGEYGGNINLMVNGDFVNFENFSDIDGITLGGVLVTVDYGGSGDIDGDGDVDFADLLALIAAWGSGDATADLNGDGVVNLADLLILIGNWGS